MATLGKIELQSAGFTVEREYPRGQWFIVKTPRGIPAVMLRQSKYIWHYFGMAHEATGSGQNPAAALDGGLGDVIGNDSELRAYRCILLDAPESLLEKSAAVYRASADIYNSSR